MSQSPSSLKILYVTAHCPLANAYGAQIRVLNTARTLKKLGTVDFVIAPHEELDRAHLERTRQEFADVTVVEMEKLAPMGLIDRLRFEFDPTFMKTHFTVVSEKGRGFLLESFPKYDLIWVHTLRTANEFRIYRWPHAVLDLDDVQSRMYQARVQATALGIRKALNYRMSLIWRRRERILAGRFDALVVCSESDRKYLGDSSQINVVPNGFSRPDCEPAYEPVQPPRIGFIGLFDYYPNRDGILWFITKVWPSIKAKAPTVRLRLVGKGSEVGFSEMGPDIDGLGYVEDASEEIASWTSMIVPLRVGGGTRIKIAEAFSRKCPVVSTSLGAFGYEVANGRDLLLADTPTDFASSCLSLIRDYGLGSMLAENGWNLFLHKWTWDSANEAVSRAVELCLNTTRGAQKAEPIKGVVGQYVPTKTGN